MRVKPQIASDDTDLWGYSTASIGEVPSLLPARGASVCWPANLFDQSRRQRPPIRGRRPDSTGEWIDPEAGKVSFKDYAAQWRASQTHRPSTAAQIETNLRRHVYPQIGDRPLVSIRRSEIQALVKDLSTDDGIMGHWPRRQWRLSTHGFRRSSLAPSPIE